MLCCLTCQWIQQWLAHRYSLTCWHTDSTLHCSDFITSTMASQITSLTVVYSTVYRGANQRKHQSSASLAFVRGIQRCPVYSPHKGPVTRKLSPFDDVIMVCGISIYWIKTSIHSYIFSSLHTSQVVMISSRAKQQCLHETYSVVWPLMTWWHLEHKLYYILHANNFWFSLLCMKY